jgi:hypothetical protein
MGFLSGQFLASFPGPRKRMGAHINRNEAGVIYIKKTPKKQLFELT